MAKYEVEEVVGYRGEFLESGHIQVCQVTHVLKEGVEISSSNHRFVVAPGEDYSNQPKAIQDICKAMHTPEVIAKAKKQQEETEKKMKGPK